MVACSKTLSLNHSISYALKNALGAFFIWHVRRVMIFEYISYMHAAQNYTHSGYYNVPGHRAQSSKSKQQPTVYRWSGMDGALLIIYSVCSFLCPLV